MTAAAAAARTRAFPLGAAATLAELQGDPHPLLARLRAREPVSWLPALGGWLISRRDLALQAMRDPATFTVDDERFSTARVIGPSMLSLDGAEHDRHRAPFARSFRRDAVLERFSELVAGETERLIDAFHAAGRAELRRSFAGPLAAAVVTHAFGLPEADTAAVLGWYDDIVAAVDAVTAGWPLTEAGITAFAELRQAIEAGLMRHLASGQGDPLGPAEAVSNAGVLLFGGIETTEGMIANAVLHLLAHPEQLALVHADARRLPNAIEESLRLEPAAAVVDRYTTVAVQFGGAAIERGELVVISVAGANRDPTVFPDPDRFDVQRENARLHLAFAHGPHVCLGMHLARLEAHTGVAGLLARLPALRLDPEFACAPRGLVFRKPPELRVLWS